MVLICYFVPFLLTRVFHEVPFVRRPRHADCQKWTRGTKEQSQQVLGQPKSHFRKIWVCCERKDCLLLNKFLVGPIGTRDWVLALCPSSSQEIWKYDWPNFMVFDTFIKRITCRLDDGDIQDWQASNARVETTFFATAVGFCIHTHVHLLRLPASRQNWYRST